MSSQRSESVLSVQPSDSPAPTLDDSDNDEGGGGGGGSSVVRRGGVSHCRAPSSEASKQHAAASILLLPTALSSATRSRPAVTSADDTKTSARAPGALFSAAAAAAGALAMTRLSGTVDADSRPCCDDDDDDSGVVEDDGKAVLRPPPLKKMLLLAGRSEAETTPCLSESAKSLKTVLSPDLTDDDPEGLLGLPKSLRVNGRGQRSPPKWSVNDDSSPESKKKKKEAEYEVRRKGHSELRDPVTNAEISKVSVPVLSFLRPEGAPSTMTKCGPCYPHGP